MINGDNWGYYPITEFDNAYLILADERSHSWEGASPYIQRLDTGGVSLNGKSFDNNGLKYSCISNADNGVYLTGKIGQNLSHPLLILTKINSNLDSLYSCIFEIPSFATWGHHGLQLSNGNIAVIGTLD